MRLAIVYHEHYSKYNLGSTHPLNPSKPLLEVELLKTIGILDNSNIKLIEPEPVSEDLLLLIHSKEYIEYIKRKEKEGIGYFDYGDTPVFPEAFYASSLAVGGSLRALELVVNEEFDIAYNPLGGFHHAKRSKAGGFCLFNDEALISLYAFLKNYDKVMVLDIDVHHADGVQELLYDKPILKVDVHEWGIYPGTGWVDEVGEGEGKYYMVNIPLPPGVGDDYYIKVFNDAVIPIVIKYKPDIMIIQAGADTHVNDPLATLNLTTNAFARMFCTLRDIMDNVGFKLVILGGGGYCVDCTIRCHVVMLLSLLGMKPEGKIPDTWRKKFKELIGYEPPQYINDPMETTTPIQVANEVEDIVDKVKHIHEAWFKNSFLN